MMHTVLLGLGSSIGDRRKYLEMAVRMLEVRPTVTVVSLSSIWGSLPVGVASNLFLNAVVRIKTSMNPRELLQLINQIEKKLGRKRGVRWADRVIDIDILLFGRKEVQEDGLTIPHPRMLERGFVIIPALEIAKDLIYPTSQQKLSDIELPNFLSLWKIGIFPVASRPQIQYFRRKIIKEF